MEEINTVSLWLGNASSLDLLEAYTQVGYSEDGDFEGSDFTRDFGISYYDDDFKEVDSLHSSKLIATILDGFSYDKKIIPLFERLLGEVLDSEINSVVLLYNFHYTGSIKISSKQGVELKYMGFVRGSEP